MREKWLFFHLEFLSPCRLQIPACRQSLHLRCLHLLIHLKSRWQRHLDLCSFRWSATTLRAVWITSLTFSPVVALFSTYEVPRDLASSRASSSVTVPDSLDLLVWQWRIKGINKNVNFLSRKQLFNRVPEFCVLSTEMAVSARVIWLCACVRYWPGRVMAVRACTGRRGAICDRKWSENFTAERRSRLCLL